MSDDKLLDDVININPEFHPLPVGAGIRFANYLLDAIGLTVVICVLLFLSGGLAIFITFPISLAYFIVLEGATGKTLGKMVTGCRVVDEYGNPPSYGTAALRTIIRMVPFEAFSILFGDNGRMWHDEWSKTYVVKDEF